MFDKKHLLDLIETINSQATQTVLTAVIDMQEALEQRMINLHELIDELTDNMQDAEQRLDEIEESISDVDEEDEEPKL